MKLIFKKDSTDKTIIVFIPDSASTTGGGKTGITYNASGLSCYYARPGAAAAQLALATQTVTGTHSDGGFVEIDATNLPGFYRLDLADAIIATGVDSASLMLKGASGMAPVPVEIQLVNYNPEDGVRMGLTALPNAAADAAGGLPISDAGGLDIDAKLAHTEEVTAARMGALTDWIDGGRLDLLIDAMKATTDQITFTGSAPNALANVQVKAQDNIDFGALQKASLNAATPASVTGAVGSVSGTVSADVVSISGDATAADNLELQFDGTGLIGSNYPAYQAQLRDIAITGSAINSTAGSFTRTLGSETGTYENTKLANGVYHQIAAENAGSTPFNIDGYYEFDIGIDGVPVEVSILGHLIEGSAPYGGDTVDIYAYNFSTSVWDHISPATGDFIGSNSTVDVVKLMSLLTTHVGTGANDGKVRIRLEGTALESGTTLYIDQILVKYTIPNTVSSTRATYLDELAAANIPADVDTLLTRITALRAGYIDNLSSGAVALASSLATVAGYVDELETRLTALRAGYLDNLSAGAVALFTQISGLNNLSSAQAQSAATAALNAYDPPTKAEMDSGHALLATASSIAALNNISTAQVLAQATAALNAYDPPTKAELDTAVSPLATATQVSGLNNLSSAQVTTAVDSALGAAVSEPASLSDKSIKGLLWHLFSRFYHKNTQTASAQVTYKANGTTVLATRTTSDDGTTQTLGDSE